MELEFDKVIILASYAVVIVSLAYIDNWVQDFKSWPNFEAIFTITQQLSNLVRQYSTGYLNLYVVCCFLAFSALCMKKKGNLKKDEVVERTERDMFATDDEYFAANDAKYKKMQPLEDMFTYVLISDDNHFSYRTGNDIYSFDEEPNLSTELVNFEHELDNSSLFCEICLENKESWEMFRNDKCSHSFCSECTTNYIITKIQDRAKAINCPSVNCKATLNSNTCRRLMIPETILAKWDELQSMSLIPESSKLYCPYCNCLAMLVNEYAETVKEVRCVACKRSFCAKCGVPWHVQLTCEEFQKLNRKKGENDEEMVKMLAMKKNWQRCSQCKMYVEKIEGCVHMTCRCNYQFCYRCGSEWSVSHEINCMGSRLH